MTPSLKNLQYLVALKKTNHFSKAANDCFVSASTFSAGISKLESDLGVLLVERDNKNVHFTATGNRVVKQALLVMAEINVLLSTAKLDFFDSEVTIGVIPTISTYILPNFLSNLSKLYPKLKVSFKEDTSKNLLMQLEQAKIDFAIFAFPYELPNFIEKEPQSSQNQRQIRAIMLWAWMQGKNKIYPSGLEIRQNYCDGIHQVKD